MKNQIFLTKILSSFIFLVFAILSNINAQPQNIKILDRFNSYPKNEFNQETGGFYDNATIQTEIVTGDNAFDKRGKTLVIHFDVNTSNGFAGYYSKLKNVSLSGYHYLSFWIKGTKGKEYLQVQLKNDKGESAKVAVWNYLIGGPTEKWQKVIIPMDAFWNLTSRDRMAEFVIVFENYQASENGSPLSSTVYIDDILFGTYFPGYLIIDNFADKIKSNAVGGNIGEFKPEGTSGSYTSAINCEEYNQDPCCLEVNYDNSKDSDYGGLFFILGGGDSGWTSISRNISEYDYLTLAVKAKSSSLNPGNFKLELKKSETEAYKAQVSNITTTFEEKIIYFDQFDPPNPDQVQELTFVFEKNVQEKLIGSIYVDDIELRKTGSKETEKLKPDKPINNFLNNIKQDEFNCKYFENNITLESILTGDISLIESVRLEYEQQNVWYVYERIYTNNSSSFSWNIQKTDLPQIGIVDIRIIAQNYNCIDSDGFYLKVTSDTIYRAVSQLDLTHIKTIQLFQNYPNPFNSETTLNFQLTKQSWVNLNIYDTLGREIRTLLNALKSKGYHNIFWDGKDNSGKKVASGLYLYKLTTDNYSDIKKMILLQ